MADEVEAFVELKGLPFTWHETKSVQWLMQFFKDLPQITHIFDLGAATGAAGIAAWRCGISYEGVCFNQAHKDWLDNVMDNCMFAVVASGIETKVSPKDQEFQEKVRHFFGPQVEEGMRLLETKKQMAVSKDEGKPDEGTPPEDDDDGSGDEC